MFATLSATLGKLAVILSLLSTALAAQTPSPSLPVSVWDGYTILKRVASCESTGSAENEPRQFNADGSVLWGRDPKLWNTMRATTTDVGELQISLTYHSKEIQELGLNVVNSEADNIAYGKILYDREGLRPWLASKNCWGG